MKGRTFDVDPSFKDIVEELNYGLMLDGEARKGRVGVIANILYAHLGDEENVGGIKIDPEINQFWGSFSGYYRLGPWDLDSEAGPDGPQLIVDPYAGRPSRGPANTLATHSQMGRNRCWRHRWLRCRLGLPVDGHWPG